MTMYSVSYFYTKMQDFKAKIPKNTPNPLVAHGHSFVPFILTPANEIPGYIRPWK